MTTSGPNVITTYSGHQLDLDNPSAKAILIEDIAAALSKICRFGAQAQVFYSVAQHALLVQDILATDLARPDLAPYGLHHDSHEAYAGDLPSPLKAKLNAESDGAYDLLTAELDDAISRALGFVIPPKGSEDHAVFKRADRTALLLEASDLLYDKGAQIRRQLERDGVRLAELASSRVLAAPLGPTEAEARFLAAHADAIAAVSSS